MTKEEKSEILKLVVEISSRIRSESSDKESMERGLKILNSFLRNLDVSPEGEVFAIFSDGILGS